MKTRDRLGIRCINLGPQAMDALEVQDANLCQPNVGVTYTIWSNQVIAISTLYASVYHLSEANIGLAYLSSGVGSLIGSVVVGKILDHDYEVQLRADYPGIETKGNEHYRVVSVEKARLRSLWYHTPLFLAGILIFGWTVSTRIHIAVSVIAMFAVGWSDSCIYAIYSTFMIDLFENQVSTSSASSNMVRCLLGAIGTATIEPMIQATDAGPSPPSLASVCLLCCYFGSKSVLDQYIVIAGRKSP
ncbi:Siderophore transporter, RhtX/FptX family [Mycena sanguinolenta]|uniref:Siderophore transporter, RhtX/FptX family n=1 Tax=Mycena sanguinolenta TaxID=230812 RepID=A0A8H6XAU9_9AGAR|nr:Siderophore transporter, RhtX/FptX family [Mycena sanguinolenta]